MKFKIPAAGVVALLGMISVGVLPMMMAGAQVNNPGVTQKGPVTKGQGVRWYGTNQIESTGAAPATGTINSVSSPTGTVAIGGGTCVGPACTFDLPSVVAAATVGSATQTPVITYDVYGRITNTVATTITPAFASLTGSIACSQLVALTGDTTKPAGSCVTTTVKVNGIAYAATAAVDTIPVITAANTTATYTAIPNCTSGALNYNTTTHLFSCAAAGSGTVTSVGGGGLAVASPSPIVGAGTITVTAATKSDQQTGTSTVSAVTPAQQQQHDSAAKAWVAFTGATGAVQSGYNVASVTRVGAGDYTVNFTTVFANTNYSCTYSAEYANGTTQGGNLVRIKDASRAVGSIGLQYFNTTPALADPTSGFIQCFGRQ